MDDARREKRNITDETHCHGRKSWYADCQCLFYTNKNRLMERLFNREVSNIIPSPNDVKNVFGKLFESNSPADSEHIQSPNVNKGDDYIENRRQTVNPITTEEIMKCRSRI